MYGLRRSLTPLWPWLCVVMVVVGCGRPEQTAPTTDLGTPARPEAGTTATGAAQYSFSPVSLSGPEKQYRSHWILRTNVTITPADGGLRCDVKGTSATSGSQYGGIKFPVTRPKAVRLDLSFVDPANIEYVYVDGYGTDLKKPLVRWSWQASSNALPTASATYTLVPKQAAGGFTPNWVTNMGAVREIHVFLKIKPNTSAGFVLAKAEVGQ